MLLACLSCTSLAAQESPLRPVRDAELRISAGAEYKPFAKKSGEVHERQFYRKFRLLGEVEWRAGENFSRTKMVNLTGGLRYKVNDFLRLGAEYRYSFRDRTRSNVQRLDLNARLQAKKDRTSLKYGIRWQHEFTPPGLDRTLLRNKLAIGYNIPKFKLDPEFSAEAFTALYYKGNRFTGMRYELGTEVALDKKKKGTLELAVRYDREMNVKEPDHRWMLVLAFQGSYKKK